MRRLWGVLTAAGALALPHLASAQAAPPADRAIDVEMFDYAIGPKTFFSVDNGSVADKHQLALDALVTFLSNPFTIYETTQNRTMIGKTRAQVVSSLTEMQLTGAYGVTDKLQVGANLPLVFQLEGDGLDATTGMHGPTSLLVRGVGDLIVEGKYRLWENPQMRLAGIAGISLPTSYGSNGSQFIGDDLPTARARLAWQWSHD